MTIHGSILVGVALAITACGEPGHAPTASIRDSAGITIVESPAPDSAKATTWDVFAPDGHLAATVSVPHDLIVRQIGADWLLGIRKGEMDEPLVVLYHLTR